MLKAIISFLSLVLIMSRVKATNNYKEGLKKAIEAFVIKSGLAKQLDARVTESTKKYAPNILKNGALVIFVAIDITENYWQIGNKWEF